MTDIIWRVRDRVATAAESITSRTLLGMKYLPSKFFDTGVKRLITEGSRPYGDANRAHIILDRASQNDRSILRYVVTLKVREGRR